MSKKFLGKVVTGAALAGAALLIATPGVAAAGVDGGKDGHDKGYISTWPRAVKPGHEVKVIQYCLRPQEEAWAWSKPTGKVWLKAKERPEPVAADMEADELGDARRDGKYDGWKKDHDYKDGIRPGNDMVEPSWGKDHEDSWGKDGYKDGIRPDPMETRAPKPTWTKEPSDEGGYKDGIRPDPMKTRAPKPTWTKEPSDEGGYKDGVGAPERWDPKWPADGEKDGVEPMADRWAKQPAYGEKDGVEPMAERWAKKPSDHGVKDGSDMAAPERWDPKQPAYGEKDGLGSRHYVYWGKAEIPWKVKPGRYWLKGSCADGKLHVVPRGWVDGGDGGTSAPNTGLAVGGAGALAAAGLGSLVLMRRRRTDGSVA